MKPLIKDAVNMGQPLFHSLYSPERANSLLTCTIHLKVLKEDNLSIIILLRTEF